MSNPIMTRGFTTREYIGLEQMTVSGTVNKLFIMFILLIIAFSAVWNQYALGYTDKVNMIGIGCSITGFMLALIIIFTRKAMNVLVPIYAFCEGAALATISAIFNSMYPGIVVQAVACTFFTLFSMLLAYKLGLIKPTEKFKRCVVIATMGFAVTYLIAFVLTLLGVNTLGLMLYSASTASIVISILACVVAALNLILDFDFVERGEQMGIAKEMEWYGAFGLMVTLVWLYIEILKLLAKLNSRR